MEYAETIVVGAGVVGLAVARALARSGREVIIVERERGFGMGTSSRSSEVIHAGLYYPPRSLKATLCIEGAARLYRFCAERRIPHRRCGKLIVATDAAQQPALQAIAERAAASGVEGLRWVDRGELATLEPHLAAHHGLLSPDTGIVDSHTLMAALLADAEAHRAVFAGGSEVMAVSPETRGFVLHVRAGATEMRLSARELVNAAGLGAQALAERIEGLPAEAIPPLHLAKGSYFAFTGRVPFSHLIYPMPDDAGLGVHLTLDLADQARFGPDVEWVQATDYDVDPARASAFAEQVRRYWPALPAERLVPAYAGIRPKLVGPGMPAGDFRIDGLERHGIVGLVNLFGIESPGLTSSLAIAEHVLRTLEGQGSGAASL